MKMLTMTAALGAGAKLGSLDGIRPFAKRHCTDLSRNGRQ